MKCVPEENDPFSFEGPEIYKCKVSVVNFPYFHQLCNILKICMK